MTLSLPSRYEHRRLLGSGGMGQVHLVFDRERGEALALKTFLPEEGGDREEARLLFKQEFWAMASLQHPHLVAAYDYGELPDGTPYLTMEPVPGADLEVGTPHDEASVRAWLPGIAAALAFLHGRGYVHGDLKPENIRLREDGLPKLMDLGLLSRVGRSGGAIRGSLQYLAPEAIKQGAVDGRTDLYGLGAVLYHALAGRPPFTETHPIALLHAHLEQAPTPLAQLAPHVGPELAGLVMRCLAKDPAARPASAAALLEALGLTTEGLGPQGLLGAPVIGREAVQARLAALLAAPGCEQLALVGPAGAGKSRLLSEWRAEAQLAGGPVLFLAGLGRDAAPYQAFKAALKSLVAQAEAPEAAATGLVERLAPLLVKLLPELGVEPAPALDPTQERVRLHAAVAELALAALPKAVWIVDDADALDAASAELVTFLRRAGAERPWRWALASGQPLEGGLADVPVEALGALDDAQVLALGEALLGQSPLPEAVAERLPTLSGGMPGAIEAVLGHWLRTGALQREGGQWVSGPASAFELPGGLQVVLDARFSELASEAQALGREAALLGASAPLALLEALSGLDQSAFFAALADLEGADVLGRDGQGYRFLRPAQAQALAASVEAGEAARFHARAAAAWRERLGADPEAPQLPLADVLAAAHHALSSPTPLDALPWVRAGARRAMALFALELAEPLLKRALALDGLADDDRLALLRSLAEAQRFKGQVDEALALIEGEILPALRAQASSDLAETLITYGVLLQLKSRYDEALTAFAEAINLTNETGDAAAGVRARTFAGRVAYFSGQPDAAKTHLASAVRRAREHQLAGLLAGALSFYGYLLASTEASRLEEGLGLLEEAIALNQELGDLVETQEALNNQGNLYLANGRLAEAASAFEAGLAVCDRMNSPNETIFALLNLGAVKLERGDLAAARANAARAAEMSRKQGRKFPEGFALALEGLCAVYQGELEAGRALLQRGWDLSVEIQNKYLELNVLAYVCEAWYELGRLDELQTALDRAEALATATQNDEFNPKFARLRAGLALARGESASFAPLAEAARNAKQPVALAQALAQQAAQALEAGAHAEAQAALQEAHALAEASALQRLRAELWTLSSRVAFAQGDAKQAAELAQRGMEEARSSGYLLGDILAQHALGAAAPGERLHRQEAPRRLNTLVGELESLAREQYLTHRVRAAVLEANAETGGSLQLDHLHHLTDLITSVSRQKNLQDLKHQAIAALVELAGAERGFLLLYNGFELTEQVFYGMSDSDAFSSSLADQVLWSGEPLTIEDAQAHGELGLQKSVQALALRSVVGVPLLDGDEVIGVMLADSQRLTKRFGPTEMDLAMALARQVAIALTNARRLERYKHANEELTLLHRLALSLVGETSLQAVLAAVAREGLPLTGADSALLLLGDDLAIAATSDAAGRPLPESQHQTSGSVCRWVYEQGESLHLLDAQADDTFQVQKSVMALGLRTVYAVPVAHGGRRLGVLYLQAQRMVDANPHGLQTLARMAELVGAFLIRQGLAP